MKEWGEQDWGPTHPNTAGVWPTSQERDTASSSDLRADTGDIGAQGPAQLHNKREVSLGYLRPCLREKVRKEGGRHSSIISLFGLVTIICLRQEQRLTVKPFLSLVHTEKQ